MESNEEINPEFGVHTSPSPVMGCSGERYTPNQENLVYSSKLSPLSNASFKVGTIFPSNNEVTPTTSFSESRLDSECETSPITANKEALSQAKSCLTPRVLPRKCSKPGTWKIENDWICCIGLPEVASTRSLYRSWFQWQPHEWSMEDWISKVAASNPNTATREHYKAYRQGYRSPNHLLSTLFNHLNVSIFVSDIVCNAKYNNYRFVTFSSIHREFTEMSANIVINSLSKSVRVHVSQGGNMWGQLFSPTLNDFLTCTVSQKMAISAMKRTQIMRNTFANAQSSREGHRVAPWSQTPSKN